MNTVQEAARRGAFTSTPHARVVIAASERGGHDRGAEVIGHALREAGHEVICTGLRQTREQIVATAIAENAPILVFSLLSGAHLTIVTMVIELLAQRRASDVHLEVVGGKTAFPTGTDIHQIVEAVDRLSATLTHATEAAC